MGSSCKMASTRNKNRRPSIDIFDLGRLTAKSMESWKSEDDTDTLRVIDKLIALNRLGFVTTNSQIGGDAVPVHADGHVMTNHREKKRAYVSALTTPAVCDTLERELSFKTEICMISRPGSSSTLSNQEIDVAFRCTKGWPLTLSKMPGAPFRETTRQPNVLDWHHEWISMMVDDDIKTDADLEKKICNASMIVYMFDPVWGRETYLIDSVLRIVKKHAASGANTGAGAPTRTGTA